MRYLPLEASPNNAGPTVSGLSDQLKYKDGRNTSAEMTVTKEDALAATEADDFGTKLNRNYKRLPPYGGQLMAIREANKVPSKTVMVSFDWNLARVYPRIIIPADAVPAELEFKFLAGLPVQIIFRTKDAHRVDALAQEILRVSPCWLATFALDLVETGDAQNLLKPYLGAEVAEGA